MNTQPMMQAHEILNLYYLLQRLQDLHNLQALQLIQVQRLINQIERARARTPKKYLGEEMGGKKGRTAALEYNVQRIKC